MLDADVAQDVRYAALQEAVVADALLRYPSGPVDDALFVLARHLAEEERLRGLLEHEVRLGGDDALRRSVESTTLEPRRVETSRVHGTRPPRLTCCG